MLCLARTTSNKIDICEALLRRALLENQDRQLLEDLLWRSLRGLEGEQRADRFWEDLQLKVPHLLFHNFETVRHDRFYHQMDTVFVCEGFVLIVELKHIAGEIRYDTSSNQLVRLYNGQSLALGDPFSQVMRHETWMQQFLWEIGVELPVITAIVVTTSSSILGQMPERYHIFKLEGLRIKLQDWFARFPRKVNHTMLHVLHEEMMKCYKPQKWQHPFPNVKLRNGALCECGLRMEYKFGTFYCRCGNKSREALLQGLHDYRLLIDEWITNKQFREFFGMESVYMASKKLNRLNLESKGQTKSRQYLIPKDIWRQY